MWRGSIGFYVAILKQQSISLRIDAIHKLGIPEMICFDGTE